MLAFWLCCSIGEGFGFVQRPGVVVIAGRVVVAFSSLRWIGGVSVHLGALAVVVWGRCLVEVGVFVSSWGVEDFVYETVVSRVWGPIFMYLLGREVGLDSGVLLKIVYHWWGDDLFVFRPGWGLCSGISVGLRLLGVSVGCGRGTFPSPAVLFSGLFCWFYQGSCGLVTRLGVILGWG